MITVSVNSYKFNSKLLLVFRAWALFVPRCRILIDALKSASSTTPHELQTKLSFFLEVLSVTPQAEQVWLV
jgi:hypothetical protein